MTQSQDIVFFDRYQQRTRREQIYGEKYLRWTYGTPMGKLALSALVKRTWFSRWYGWRMDRPRSRRKIQPFIDGYDVDAAEFVRTPQDFESFNAFFSRALQPSARPVHADPQAIVFPADGRHLCVPNLSQCQGLFVKGQTFDLATLLQDKPLATEFSGGSLVLSRLCPVDYHRFHFPVTGRAGPTRVLNGPLFSVNPIALCQNIHILTTNKRALTVLESETLGKVLLLEIGATNVGSICQTYKTDSVVSKGDEKGYFRFGGSATIAIFAPGTVRFDDDLLNQSAAQRELYARMGDRMALAV
ncbi:MAG: phosphatidylserine decarboxylase [Planctomycetota bacterium]|nr:phosphatidylserine decarboxylase [Planctomycetota bacterium]